MINLNNMNGTVNALVIFILAFFGAIFNDYYNTITDKDETVKIARVLLSSFTGTILSMALSNYVLRYIDNNVFVLISFVSGVTGFQIFEKLKNVNLFNIGEKLLGIVLKEKGYKKDEKGNDDEET